MSTVYRTNTTAIVSELGLVARRIKDDRPLLERFGARMVEYSIPENFAAGGRPGRWPSTHRGGQTLVDTARLRASLRAQVGLHQLRVGTNLRYARIHQEGGEIKRKGKALAIPMAVAGRRRRPGQYGDRLQWAPTQTGRGRLVEQVGKGKRARLITRFLLVDKVRIPARPFLLFQREDLAWMERETFRYVLARRAV